MFSCMKMNATGRCSWVGGRTGLLVCLSLTSAEKTRTQKKSDAVYEHLSFTQSLGHRPARWLTNRVHRWPSTPLTFGTALKLRSHCRSDHIDRPNVSTGATEVAGLDNDGRPTAAAEVGADDAAGVAGRALVRSESLLSARRCRC